MKFLVQTGNRFNLSAQAWDLLLSDPDGLLLLCATVPVLPDEDEAAQRRLAFLVICDIICAVIPTMRSRFAELKSGFKADEWRLFDAEIARVQGLDR